MNRSKRPIRRVAVLTALVASILVVAGTAWAHVTVRPGSAERGSFEILNFSVPNERDDASTVEVAVEFPTTNPIPSIRVQPKPGWTYTVERTTLDEPVELHGSEVSEVISKITWTGGEIKPGEFDLFTVSAGPLPAKGKSIAFPATQTYSSGEVVTWNQRVAPGGDEPEFPAPVLTLTKASSSGH